MRHLTLIKPDAPTPAEPPHPLGLETTAQLLEARANRTPRVLISDALARDIAGALRHLAALRRQPS